MFISEQNSFFNGCIDYSHEYFGMAVLLGYHSALRKTFAQFAQTQSRDYWLMIVGL